MDLYCARCGKNQPINAEKQFFKDNTIHIRATCGVCDTWIKWLEKNEEHEIQIKPVAQQELFQ